MSIRRLSSVVTNYKHKSDPQAHVVELTVQVEGSVEDRGDCLLMILDAWNQAMLDAGLDPDSAYHNFRTHGRLQ